MIDPDVLRLASTVLLLARVLDHEVREGAADGLGVVDLSVLRLIDRGVELPSLVARGLQLDPGRVTRIVDHLAALGYVTRDPDQVDRRRCRLRLTVEGSARVIDGRLATSHAMSGLLNGLNEAERTGLERGLDGARRVLDALQHAEMETNVPND